MKKFKKLLVLLGCIYYLFGTSSCSHTVEGEDQLSISLSDSILDDVGLFDDWYYNTKILALIKNSDLNGKFSDAGVDLIAKFIQLYADENEISLDELDVNHIFDSNNELIVDSERAKIRYSKYDNPYDDIKGYSLTFYKEFDQCSIAINSIYNLENKNEFYTIELASLTTIYRLLYSSSVTEKDKPLLIASTENGKFTFEIDSKDVSELFIDDIARVNNKTGVRNLIDTLFDNVINESREEFGKVKLIKSPFNKPKF